MIYYNSNTSLWWSRWVTTCKFSVIPPGSGSSWVDAMETLSLFHRRDMLHATRLCCPKTNFALSPLRSTKTTWIMMWGTCWARHNLCPTPPSLQILWTPCRYSWSYRVRSKCLSASKGTGYNSVIRHIFKLLWFHAFLFLPTIYCASDTHLVFVVF